MLHSCCLGCHQDRLVFDVSSPEHCSLWHRRPLKRGTWLSSSHEVFDVDHSVTTRVALEVLDWIVPGGNHPPAIELKLYEFGSGGLNEDVIANLAVAQVFELSIVVVIGKLEASSFCERAQLVEEVRHCLVFVWTCIAPRSVMSELSDERADHILNSESVCLIENGGGIAIAKVEEVSA